MSACVRSGSTELLLFLKVTALKSDMRAAATSKVSTVARIETVEHANLWGLSTKMQDEILN